MPTPPSAQALDQMRTSNETLSFSHTDKTLNELDKEFASMTHIEQELRKSRTFRQAAGKHAVLSITYVRRRLWWYLVTRVIAFMAGCVFLLESLISVKAFFEINTQIGTLSSVSVPVEAQLNQIIYHPTTSELSPLLLGIAFLLVSLVSFVCVLITHYRIHQFLENVGIQGQLMELRSHEDGMSDSDKQ